VVPLTINIDANTESIVFNGVTYTETTTINVNLGTYYNIVLNPVSGNVFSNWNQNGVSFYDVYDPSTTASVNVMVDANLSVSYI
jgi:hypothetical protein